MVPEPSSPPADVRLRELTPADLDAYFEHQADPGAAAMVGLPARDRDDFLAHWAKHLQNGRMVVRTILADGVVAGNVVCFELEGEPCVGYQLGRAHWGRGIATRALAQFLALLPTRPLRAHVAPHNVASRRVLEKCGFAQVGESGSGSTALLVFELRE